MATDNTTKLEALRAAKAERDAKRASAAQAAAEADEIAALELDETIAELEAQYGAVGRGIEVVRANGVTLVVRRPDPVTYRKFLDNVETAKSQALIDLVRGSLAHPEKAELDAALKAAPALVIRASVACQRLAGMQAEETSGK